MALEGLPVPASVPDAMWSSAMSEAAGDHRHGGESGSGSTRPTVARARRRPRDWLDFGIRAAAGSHASRLDLDIEVYGSDYNRRLVTLGAGEPADGSTRRPTRPMGPPLELCRGLLRRDLRRLSAHAHARRTSKGAWMREFRRLLVADGRLVVTTHGAGHVGNMLRRARALRGGRAGRAQRTLARLEPLQRLSPARVAAGLLDGSRRSRSAAASAFTQDVWVLRARPRAPRQRRG